MLTNNDRKDLAVSMINQVIGARLGEVRRLGGRGLPATYARKVIRLVTLIDLCPGELKAHLKARA